MMINKIRASPNQNFLLKSLSTTSWDLTDHNSIKIPKILKPTVRFISNKTLRYKCNLQPNVPSLPLFKRPYYLWTGLQFCLFVVLHFPGTWNNIIFTSIKVIRCLSFTREVITNRWTDIVLLYIEASYMSREVFNYFWSRTTTLAREHAPIKITP